MARSGSSFASFAQQHTVVRASTQHAGVQRAKQQTNSNEQQ